MSGAWRKVVGLALGIVLVAAGAASAKEQYVYTVKFVCGYNDSNVGIVYPPDGQHPFSAGEPSVKFGNYATEINIIWPEIYLGDEVAYVFKHPMVLVDRGFPVGREPRVASSKPYADSVRLGSLQGTMDDCNRIAEMLWGSVPTPFPLTIGYLTLTSTHEIDVTAVYTSQACNNWVQSSTKLDCLDASGKYQGVSSSIEVERIPTRKLIF